MTGQTYPTAQPVGGGADVAGEVFACGFDAMGRPTTMTSGGGATNWISGTNLKGRPPWNHPSRAKSHQYKQDFHRD